MIKLSDINAGSTVRVLSVNGGFGFTQRMAEMGIMQNSLIKVLKNDRSGPMVIIVKGSRFALGRGMASKIYCEIV